MTYSSAYLCTTPVIDQICNKKTTDWKWREAGQHKSPGTRWRGATGGKHSKSFTSALRNQNQNQNFQKANSGP